MAGKIPVWVGDTPAENSYDLTIFDGGGGSIEEISLSRAEYISLKRHLAVMRGYTDCDGNPLPQPDEPEE